jgi:Spy/CpxP family protein refolding chaperone
MRLLHKLVLIFAAVLQFAIVPLTWAQNGPFDPNESPGQSSQELLGGEPGQGGFHQQLQKELNLSDEQRQALKGMKESRQENRQLQMKLMQQRQELNEALRSGLFSESDVMDKVKQINESSAQLNTNRVQNIVTLKKTLKPEQLSKLREFMQQHRQQRQERMQKFGGMHGGQGMGVGEGGGLGFGQQDPGARGQNFQRPFQGKFRQSRERRAGGFGGQ